MQQHLAALLRRETPDAEQQATMEAFGRESREQQRVEEALTSSYYLLAHERQCYRKLCDLSQNGYLVTDPHGTIQEVNQVAATLLQTPQDHLVGMPLAAFIAVHDRQVVQTLFHRVEHEGALREQEVGCQPREGVPFVGALSAATLRTPQGTLTGIHWLLRDLTTSRHIEKARQACARQQAVLAELGLRGQTTPSCSVFLNEVTVLIARTLNVEYCQVLQLLPDRTALQLRAGVGWREGAVGQTIISAGRESQAGYTLLSCAPVVVEDLRTERRFSEPSLTHEYGVVSSLSVPLHGPDVSFRQTCLTPPNEREASASMPRGPACVATCSRRARGRQPLPESSSYPWWRVFR